MYSHAHSRPVHKNEAIIKPNVVFLSGLTDSIKFDQAGYTAEDTITLKDNSPDLINSNQNEKFSIPYPLAGTPINFQINSFIYYLSFDHFVNDESKRSFFQGWLKEKELQKLSLHTDSLRRAYSSTFLDERAKIASRILAAEQQSIALNEEITASYQKARKLEHQYWQTASMDEIATFQQKISMYEDSVANTRQEATHVEVHDTITLYVPEPRVEEQKAEATGDIIYKIQIGSYKGKVPDSANKLIKKLSIIRKVDNHVDEKGYKVYTTGNLRLYPEAVTMLSQVKQEGVKNALITAYQNGKKIPVTEAKKLNNEL